MTGNCVTWLNGSAGSMTNLQLLNSEVHGSNLRPMKIFQPMVAVASEHDMRKHKVSSFLRNLNKPTRISNFLISSNLVYTA